jgi:hypothetical protein
MEVETAPSISSIMEPVLVKYKHVFHEEGSNDFQDTDLGEHQIVTGDAKPIRKPPTEYHSPSGKRWKTRYRTSWKKGLLKKVHRLGQPSSTST